MPESFVEAVHALNVLQRVWSHGGRWGTMSASPATGRVTSSPAAIPLLPGREQLVWLLLFAGWTVVGLGYFGSSLYPIGSTGTPEPIAWGRLLVYCVGTAWIWALLTPAVLWLIRDAHLDSGSWSRAVGRYLVVAAGFFVVSGILEWGLGVASGITRPDQFWATLLSECVETRLLAYLAIVVLGWSARYFALYRSRNLHASDLEARLAKTHLQVLKMQLQPHFLFNTLNAIAELVHTDPEAADQMITRLGRLLRLSLDHAGHQVVPLRQEADFLRVYIEIERVRFQDRLEIVWDLAADTLDAAVPTLLLQPVLENAIRHGISALTTAARVVIASRQEGDELVLEIRDNGRGLPEETALREGVGLRNVRERVDQLYGARARVMLTPALGGGTLAMLRLPFSTCETAYTPVPLPTTTARELVP